MNTFGTFTKLRSQSLLRHLSSCSDTTCLQVSGNSVLWLVYLDQGKITYATHSIEPFDRLERHLRRLSHQVPNLTSEARVQLRLLFESDSNTQFAETQGGLREQAHPGQLPPEYQAICWLVSQRYLHSTQAAVLIQELVKEVIEALLLVKSGIYEFRQHINRVPIICKLDIEKIVERCHERLQSWRSLAPHISSPYQRPYLWVQTTNQSKGLPDIQQNLAEWMKGFSLRHLAVIMNQDEIQLARNLYPYIVNGIILLHEPDPPFDKLPKTFEELSTEPIYKDESTTESSTQANRKQAPEHSITSEQRTINQQNYSSQNLSKANNITPTATAKKIYKIVSVDDSPTILKEISRFLEDESFAVITINDPVKAVMSIIRHKPDLILLDLNMDGLDGYELCRIIRNNSMFKNTPIVMVTGNKGLIDKVKARLVGASGYLTKPFTRADLLKVVFMHLI